jgi:hypothetical protein
MQRGSYHEDLAAAIRFSLRDIVEAPGSNTAMTPPRGGKGVGGGG